MYEPPMFLSTREAKKVICALNCIELAMVWSAVEAMSAVQRSTGWVSLKLRHDERSESQSGCIYMALETAAGLRVAHLLPRSLSPLQTDKHDNVHEGDDGDPHLVSEEKLLQRRSLPYPRGEDGHEDAEGEDEGRSEHGHRRLVEAVV